MSKIEIYPFIRMSWRNRQIRDKWEPLRKRIYQATFFAEYEMVKRGYREANVYQLDPNQFDHQIEKVMQDGLVYLPILRSKTYQGYGHRHYFATTIEKDTFIYGVVARDLEIAREFKKASLGNIDHTRIGELLGYPKCCIDFFNNVWLRDGCLDPMVEIGLNTGGVEGDTQSIDVVGHPFLNRMIRYFGFNIIPFFPHSFDCEEALKFAKIWFDLMGEYDDEASEACLEILKMPLVWSLNSCIIYVEHPLFIGAANGYYTEKRKEIKWSSSL